MAISFLQKIKLGLKGWSRRRAADSVRRNEEFLAKQTGWVKEVSSPAVKPASAATPASTSAVEVDVEGLQVAYLDDSGQLEHFLDRETGEVLDVPLADIAGIQAANVNPARFRRVPRRSTESDAAERLRFAQNLDEIPERPALVTAAPSPADFRKLLSTNRTLERAWYNFKNDEANQVIEAWLGNE
ncbi:MAG TPA: hypothetical protein VHL58_07800 [Thermoanaerobaculia bacterium]|nr:hypothetical protein [Thermoanaerobaculia bacterium]